MIRRLDGPLGTELSARSVNTDLPQWSAAAIDSHPEVIAEIHRDYANAGATIHTANTFRTKRRTVGNDWLRMTLTAVQLARQSIPKHHLVAGSIAPLEDCYRPDLAPAESSDEHRELCDALADVGCDILLCETFANVREAIIAVTQAVATGGETWLALTAGPQADLLTPSQMADGARRAADAGATAVLVNCTAAASTLPFVQAIAAAKLSIPIGAYANAGVADSEIGWQSSASPSTTAYLNHARTWVDAGATIIGGCCGTTPAHIEALSQL